MKSKLAGLQITSQQTEAGITISSPAIFEPVLERELSQIAARQGAYVLPV